MAVTSKARARAKARARRVRKAGRDMLAVVFTAAALTALYQDWQYVAGLITGVVLVTFVWPAVSKTRG